MFPIQSVLAQAQQNTAKPPNNTAKPDFNTLLIGSSATIIVVLIGVIVFTQLQLKKLKKSLKFEELKSKDSKGKLKLALVTIKKMESNPDLVHSREFNLDYLRLRMEEEMFHSLIVNRLKIKITQIITVALRPDASEDNIVGIAGTGRKINEVFDVTYEIQNQEGEWKTRVLFRVQIKMTKLPTQSTTSTINQILDCMENYLSPQQRKENWQPSIQGRQVRLDWDQNAKPTPLLVLEQLQEGVTSQQKQNRRSRRSH